MVKRTGSTNEHLKKLIRTLSRDKKPIWKRVAMDLNKPARKRREVNLKRINDNTNSGETIIVPGKVLGTGRLNHKLTIAAWRFSDSALKKIKQAKGKAISIKELYDKKKIGRIIG
ncbi:50S ribosomal protein L18e [archaeon]|nr:50S ribosomal protein L18e [archaeon]